MTNLRAARITSEPFIHAIFEIHYTTLAAVRSFVPGLYKLKSTIIARVALSMKSSLFKSERIFKATVEELAYLGFGKKTT